MTESLSTTGIRGILLDVEGTTTPIAFVHDVLFTYARAHVQDYLVQHAHELADDIAQLRDEHSRDVNAPLLTEAPESIATYVLWLIDRDRKSTGLKSLQGKIWREGYVNGTLKAQVFDDVRPAFERWKQAALQISIFSSGSVLAQQLLFAHTDHGDLTKFISDYFDTNVGAKGDAESYRQIATRMNFAPKEILFISDVVTELEAATTAGMQTRLSVRSGNQPQPDPDRFRIIHTLDEI